MIINGINIINKNKKITKKSGPSVPVKKTNPITNKIIITKSI